MKKVLITGITGFAGSFLAEHLLSGNNYEVVGTYLSESSLGNISSIKDRVLLTQVNLQDFEATQKLIEGQKFDVIFHLAALASAADSFKNPSEYINNNISVQVNILESIKKLESPPKVLIVSSAEVYGDVSQNDLPINENVALRPTSPYGVSKIAQDFMGLQYFLSYNIPVIRVRPFNHIGPRQAPGFVVSSFAKKIADIENGKIPPVLYVGNLEAKRDFTDVKDMVRAYKDLVEKGEMGEVYNAGSGKSHYIKDILGKLLSFSTTEIEVKEDPALLRPIDIADLVCDITKINSKKVAGKH